jgi:hypothetical protein
LVDSKTLVKTLVGAKTLVKTLVGANACDCAIAKFLV